MYFKYEELFRQLAKKHGKFHGDEIAIFSDVISLNPGGSVSGGNIMGAYGSKV